MQAVTEERNAAVEGTEQTQETEQIQQAEEKPRYIENPLPLPKKHVRKEMDYQYHVAEKDMKYDVEVSEDDDFDIQ